MIYNFENEATTLSVLEFLQGVNTSLLRHRGRIAGEVTSIKNTYASAVYFSIKDTDGDALLNCVMWRTTYRQNGVDLKEGDQVIVTGVPEIYAARGSFSLKVQTVEYAGEGALKKAYDTLRQQLDSEGLLALSRKRALPEYPKRIGVITSKSGVVIQDFSANLGRYGFLVTMVDSRVEGKDAIHELLAAIRTMAKEDIEVLVIMRGGGSWESLQAFNTESVVRAIADFPKPVVTGIGHDVDVTLSELVADVGSSTPTAVAEVLNESWDTLQHSYQVAETAIFTTYQQALVMTHRFVDQRQTYLLRRFELVLTHARAQYQRTSQLVQRAYRTVARRLQDTDRLFAQLTSVFRFRLGVIDTFVRDAQTVLMRQMRRQVTRTQSDVQVCVATIGKAEQESIHATYDRLRILEQQLKAYDPNRPLQLGYSVTYVDGKLVRRATDVTVGQTVTTTVKDGSFISTINKVL